jgi:GDP-L-fucose synthase
MSKPKVIITGLLSFVGRHVKKALEERGYEIHPASYYISREKNDLRNWGMAKDAIAETGADYLIHLAAVSGGISYNATHGPEIFYDNTILSLNTLKATSLNPNIKKVVSIISSCAYPDLDVLKEEDFWSGKPNESIKFFGYQKKNIVLYGEALQRQNPGKVYRNLCLNNLYGPGDSLDLNKTKVCMALVKRIYDAKCDNLPEVILLGDAKNVYRQLTYVADAAKWIVTAMEQEDCPPFINLIGDEQESSIYDLAVKIADIVGYRGHLGCDLSKPSGQAHKVLDGSACRAVFGGFRATPLEEGLKRTVEYYEGILNENG